MMGTNRPPQRFPYSQNNQGTPYNYNANSGRPPRPGRPVAVATAGVSHFYNYQPQMYPPPPPPPRPPRPPGMLNFVAGEILDPNSLAPPGTVQQPRPLPPPPHVSSVVPPGTEFEQTQPPPPPPLSAAESPLATGHYPASGFPPLAPPPLPPMFPYMSVELALSLELGASQCGQSFEKEKSDLPFVPVIINDDDLKKMTETVKTQTEESKSIMDKLFYKDILDPNMPQALRDMLQPLYCKLCKLTLSSPVVARDHYKGKRHKKAEEVWLQSNPQRANKPPMNKGANVQKLNGIVRPAGSNNQFNPRRPGPAGGFRSERPSFAQQNFTQQIPPPGANNPRFSQPPFNQQRKRPAQQLDQQQEEIPIPEFIPAYRAALANPRKKKPRKEGGGSVGGGPNFAYCDLCSVSLTSQAHADQHFNGKNHKQRMLTGTRNGEFGGDPRFGIGTGFAPA